MIINTYTVILCVLFVYYSSYHQCKSLSFPCSINVWLSKSCYFSLLFLVTFSSTAVIKLFPFDEPRNKCLNDWFLSWSLQEIEITFLSSKEVFDGLSIVKFQMKRFIDWRKLRLVTLSVAEERDSRQEKDKEESLLAPERKFLSGNSLSRDAIQVSNWIFHRDRVRSTCRRDCFPVRPSAPLRLF